MDAMVRSFGRVLNDLGGAEETCERALDEPQLRVSARAGSIVASLGPMKKGGFRRQFPHYGITPDEPPQPEPHLSLPDLEKQIGKARSMEELCRLRRRFARASHPDCCGDSSAASEMAVANRLIDDAIAALRGGHGAR
jgi:hypothetical protein